MGLSVALTKAQIFEKSFLREFVSFVRSACEFVEFLDYFFLFSYCICCEMGIENCIIRIYIK